MYLHGFVDYFFQVEHAALWRDHGYDFYALDLRKYGRSMRPGQSPNWVTDLRTYDEDIDAALKIIREEHGHQKVVLLGHSTGGLIAPLYVSDHPGGVIALVLNSPWFDLNSNWFNRVIATRVIDLVGGFVPHVRVGQLGDAYGRSLHTSTGGQWNYDLAWKPLAGFPVHAGWLRAIRRGHARVRRGLHIGVPVLVCTSSRSGHPVHPTPNELMSTDCVLNVEHMTSLAPRLGNDVTVRRIPGGRHDLALSDQPARAEYEHVVFDWLSRRLP
nr:alpha/beta hydrolase [Microlunatus panaciterrae]